MAKMTRPMIDIVKLMKQFEMKVTFKRVKEMKLRMWLASWFLRIAFWIMGMDYSIEYEEDNE